MIDQLAEAEMYLTEYIGNADAYEAIEHQEQQFTELQKALDKKTDQGEKELARKLCYVITKHSREFETRAYDIRLAFGAKTKEVAERLAERLEIELPDASGTAKSAGGDKDDIFGDDGETSPDALRYAPIKKALAKKSQSKMLAEAIKEILTEIRSEDEDEDKARRPLKEVKKVRQMLGRIDLDSAGKNTLGELQTELEQIAAIVKTMIKQLK